MKFFPILIIIYIHLTISDIKDASQKQFQKLEKKAKALACSVLSKSFVSSVKDYDQKLQELLKQNNFIQNGAEAKDKIAQFMMVNCYLKITSDIANKVILELSKGNIDVKNNKQYLNLFEMDKNTDFNKLGQTMKEINEIMKELKAEEELFAKTKKDDPNFQKNLKDFEEKMKKNYEQKKNEKNKNSNNAKHTSKKKKGNGKKPYEGTKWEFVESSEEQLLEFKDIIFNPKKFFDVTGLNTICGMIIMTLIVINIVQIFNNFKNKKNHKKEDEDKVNEEDINELNRENNDNEEEEDDDNNDNNDVNNVNNDNNDNTNNINNEVEKEKLNEKIDEENKD